MIDRDSLAMLTLLIHQWNELRSELPRMHPGANVRPDEPTVLQAVHGPVPAVAYFKLSPVVFNLPERATHASSNLFVVVRGRLSFDRAAFREHRHLMTRSFATEVRAFRKKEGLPPLSKVRRRP